MVLFWTFVFLIPLIDILIKNNICNYVTTNNEIDTFIPFLKIAFVKNYGVAFGMFQKHTYITVILTSIMLISMIMMVAFRKVNNRMLIITFAFIVGGGAGNLIDRITLGYVIDYLKLTFFPPVCNLSDYFISIGAIMLAFYGVFRKSV